MDMTDNGIIYAKENKLIFLVRDNECIGMFLGREKSVIYLCNTIPI